MLGFAGGDPCAPAVGSVRSRPCGDGRSLTTRTPTSLYGCRRPAERYTISSTGPGDGEGVRRSALVLGFAGGDPCAPAVGSVRSRPCGDGRSLTTRTPTSL